MLEENYQKQNIENEVENLNEIIKEKEKEIEELKEEVDKYKKNNSFSTNNKKDSSMHLQGIGDVFKNERLSLVGEGTDQEKIERLVMKLKEYKNESETNQELIKILKEDHKNMKAKLANFETFGGKIKDYNEFIKLFNICLKDYKPKKKEQKEALAKLREHLKKELD